MLLSEMSLPGVEAPIEKLLPKILGKLEKNSLNDNAKVPLYRAKVRRDVVSFGMISIRYVRESSKN